MLNIVEIEAIVGILNNLRVLSNYSRTEITHFKAKFCHVKVATYQQKMA